LASFKKGKTSKVEEDIDEEEEVHESFQQQIKAPSPFKAIPQIENNLVESYQSDIQTRSVSQSPVQEVARKQQVVERALPTSKGNNIEARLDYVSLKQELGETDGSADSKAVMLLEALGSVCFYQLTPRTYPDPQKRSKSYPTTSSATSST
jgi:hypothetical protein